MKYYLLLMLFLVQLHATPLINIDSDSTSLKDFNLEYFVDSTEVMPLEEIKKQTFIQDKSTLSLGVFQDVAWLRFKLHNTTQKTQKLYIHNELAYIVDGVDFYEFHNNKLINS